MRDLANDLHGKHLTEVVFAKGVLQQNRKTRCRDMRDLKEKLREMMQDLHDILEGNL